MDHSRMVPPPEELADARQRHAKRLLDQVHRDLPRNRHVPRAPFQLALSFAANKNSVLTKEIPETIRLKLSKQFAMDEPEVIVEKTFQDLWKIDEASHRFAHLTRVLHELSRMLEKERMTFKHVGKFRNRPEVKTLLVDLEREFARDLADNGDEQSSGQKLNGDRHRQL